MLHKLEPILNHPTYQMQEILMSAVNAAVNNTPFSRDIFPQLLQNNWTNNSDFVRKLEDVLYAHISQLDDKEAFKLQFINNNDIQILCNDTKVSIIDKIDWDREVELKKFFLSCYSRLDSSMFCQDETEQKARKEYDNLFRKINKYVCPFCGLNQYPNINRPNRADFDHFIYKGKYPLSSANMRNLIPMCCECNRDVKKTKNILIDDDRVYAFYPYDDIEEIKFSIECLEEPNTVNNEEGKWDLSITPVLEDEIIEKKIETWIRVFDIKQRYIEDIQEFHNDWIISGLQSRLIEFTNLDEMKIFFQEKSREFEETVRRKMEVKAHIKMIFFNFMSESASNRFLNRYFYLHNRQRIVTD